MRKILLVVAALTIYSLLQTPQTQAQQFSVGLHPPVITMTTQQPGLIEKQITLENFSEKTTSLLISFREFSVADATGDISLIPNSPELTAFLQRVNLLDENGSTIREITLAPKQKRTLRLKVDLYPTDPDGTFLFSVIFQQQANDLTEISVTEHEPISSTHVLGGIATNVIVHVGKKTQPQGHIEEFSTYQLIKNGPVPFTVRLKNTGKEVVKPAGQIRIRNIFGKTVGLVALPEVFILPGKTRTLSDEYNDLLDSASQNITSTRDVGVIGKIHWTEPVFLGPYTAVLEISLADGQPPIVKSATFFVFPTYALIFSIIAMLFLLWFSARLRRYLQP